MKWNTVEEALEALRAGKCILVTDDPDRENERGFDLCRTVCNDRKCQSYGILRQRLDLYADESGACGTTRLVADGTP